MLKEGGKRHITIPNAQVLFKFFILTSLCGIIYHSSILNSNKKTGIRKMQNNIFSMGSPTSITIAQTKKGKHI
jgi:hypothetical protein